MMGLFQSSNSKYSHRAVFTLATHSWATLRPSRSSTSTSRQLSDKPVEPVNRGFRWKNIMAADWDGFESLYNSIGI